MSHDHRAGRKEGPEMPRLPAPPAVMRGLRPRRIPLSGTWPAAAPAHGPLAACSPNPGDRTAEDTSRRPR
jgi:hypothetical protein